MNSAFFAVKFAPDKLHKVEPLTTQPSKPLNPSNPTTHHTPQVGLLLESESDHAFLDLHITIQGPN
ncbi:hypothetical protein RvY_18789 [Ramazzottius varieornatus]|uniref:Uncharacterized protein n=1 Tax=Ramazzottius varieornatus TaxID=947166 RepID=A0A1D1WB47_RAMVA|nr:hypothetical protein RvY_18789 [Ramazzottius varieornatus]